MKLITSAPPEALKLADRVMAVAPGLTWKWRYAIFLELLMREVETTAAPGWRVTVGGFSS